MGAPLSGGGGISNAKGSPPIIATFGTSIAGSVCVDAAAPLPVVKLDSSIAGPSSGMSTRLPPSRGGSAGKGMPEELVIDGAAEGIGVSEPGVRERFRRFEIVGTFAGDTGGAAVSEGGSAPAASAPVTGPAEKSSVKNNETSRA